MNEIRRQLQVSISVDTHTKLWKIFQLRRKEAKAKGLKYNMADYFEQLIADEYDFETDNF